MGKFRCRMLNSMVEKLQRSLSRRDGVPDDVKEGHFAVYATDGGTLKRFVVELKCLTHPDFLRFLKQAEEEFGFKQEGALVIPCCPGDLQKILED